MSFRVLVLGDVLVDRYFYVTTRRQASEAPIPVWDEVRQETRLGGAANVANNLKALGGEEVDVFLAGVCYDREVSRLIRSLGINDMVTGNQSLVKSRFVDPYGRYVFRHDNSRSFDQEEVASFETVFSGLTDRMDFDAVVVSDYDAGTVTEKVALSMKAPLRVVDSKRLDLSCFRGYDVLKLNEDEHGRQVSFLAGRPERSVERLFNNVVVTRGAQGAQLRCAARSIKVKGPGSQTDVVGASDDTYITHVEEFPVEKVRAVDVTGCGDTHVAAMTLALLKTRDVRKAVKFANVCAQRKVQLFGTDVPSGMKMDWKAGSAPEGREEGDER